MHSGRAISVQLTQQDTITTIYRGVHDMLAKGVPTRLLWAELAGRVTGTCKGKGGPMHITHPDSGCMVTTGIVGASMPIACGLALAAQQRGQPHVTIANFGDGASNIGAFHESLNLAAVWKLPVIFVCQNNRFAEHTALRNGTSVERIAIRAAGYGIPGVTVDGNDPLAVYDAAETAIARARAGDGPTLGVTDPAAVAIPLTAMAIASMVAAGGYGLINRLLGTNATFVGGATIVGIGLLICSTAPTVTVLVIGAVLMGAGLSICCANLYTAASASRAGAPGPALGVINAAMYLAPVIFPLIMGPLAAHLGAGGVLLVFAVLMLGAAATFATRLLNARSRRAVAGGPAA